MIITYDERSLDKITDELKSMGIDREDIVNTLIVLCKHIIMLETEIRILKNKQ